MKSKVFIALGSNIGNLEDNLNTALKNLEKIGKVEKLLNTLNARLENQILNNIIPPATTEVLAIYLFEEIKKTFPQICRIELNEKENYGAVYEE